MIPDMNQRETRFGAFAATDEGWWIPKAMTIAGSDSGGGAGIQADLKTFAAHGVYGTSAITAVTAQNTTSVLAIAEVPEEVIVHQIDGVLEDIGTDAIKTGMLSSASIIETIADRIDAWGVTALVVDPVMVAKSGDALLHPTAVKSLIKHLLPLALIVTPNIPEAEVLSGITVDSEAAEEEAARIIYGRGARFVVIKGGHKDGDEAIDLIFDGTSFERISAPRVITKNTHGTGCTFSAAIAANLSLGLEPMQAVIAAKAYLTTALQESFVVGSGHSPVNHFFASAEFDPRPSAITTGGTHGPLG